jgi:hypothetical protein
LSEITQPEPRQAIRLNDDEWGVVRNKAFAEFKALLGERPDRKSVSAKRHDKPFINFVWWFGIITFIALGVVTSLKALFVTVPFSHEFSELTLKGEGVDPFMIWLFMIAYIVLNIVMSTPALIFFKLLSEEERILKKIKETKRQNISWFNPFEKDFILWVFLDLNWLTPRLPSALVWGIMGWMLWTAWAGVYDLSSALMLFLPVFAELTLARLVGDILQQNIHFFDLVTDVLKTETDKWDAELKGYETDERYLQILYRHLRSAVINVSRHDDKKRRISPNAWMMQSGSKQVKEFILSEYTRLTEGHEGAITMLAIRNNREAGQPESVVAAAASDQSATTHKAADAKRTPKLGDKKWTVETLIRDFEKQGLSKAGNYDRGWLDRNYADGYGARSAWAGGAKDYFTS